MLRPATPLTVVLLAAFVLLLLSVLTVPVTKALYLGQAGDVKFGVFGYCDGDKCSSIGIGYDTDELLKGQKVSLHLPEGVRKSLSSVLVIHPVAAVLALIMVIMAGFSHTHGAAHSSRYLLAMFVLMIITFVACVVSFVIDILLFIPHLAFGSYFTIAAAVLLGIGAVVSCIMRRMVVGRKARRKKIAENAEMSGENYYNRENHKPVATFNTNPTVPSISGANGTASDSLPAFASFENRKKEDQVSDERIPLTQINTNRSQGSNRSEVNAYGINRSGSRDEFGNPARPYASSQGRPSFDRGRGGADPYRSGQRTPRGGYGRGGYDGYGPPMRGRGGGPGLRGRGGYGPPRGGRGGYGPPRGGGYGRGGGALAMGAMAAAYAGRPSTDSYDSYAQQQRPVDDRGQNWGTASNPSTSNLNAAYQGYEADSTALPRAESPPPLPADGQSVHSYQGGYDNTGAMQNTNQYGQYSQHRGNDSETQPSHRERYMSDGSKYSTEEYIPPRAGWNQSGHNSPRGQSPASQMHQSSTVERQGSMTGLGQPAAAGDYYDEQNARYDTYQQQSQQHLTTGEPYYEDAHANIDGSRSPAESERSTFTSISQRGVNPRWNPNQNHPPMPSKGPPARRAVQQRHDMILDNPDFQMPGARSGKSNAALVPGSAYPT